jgi:glycosyltransferase involved in cell wall biosynthesis
VAPDLSLVIPCYNEEKNIEKVVREMVGVFDAKNIDYELVLVNNGSLDNTGRIIENISTKNPRIKVVHVKKNEGYGWGIINGLRKASGSYLGFTDADGQIPAIYVVRIYEKLKLAKLDLCKGRRILRDDGLLRIFLSKSYGIILSLLFFIWISDVNGKAKIMSRKCYEELEISSKDWFIDTEIVVKSKQRGFRIGEVPIEFKKRKSGKSNVNVKIIFEFLINCIKFRFLKY